MREWIKCSDRLPEEGGEYLVVVEEKAGLVSKNRYVDAASNYGDYIDDYWNTWNDWKEGQEVHVTHWMPLPELPEDK